MSQKPPALKFARMAFENGPNWRYAVGLACSDPHLWYQTPSGKTHIIVSELELTENREHAKVNHVHGFGELKQKPFFKDKPLSLLNMVKWLMELEQPDGIEVPPDFPAALFMRLTTSGVPVQIAEGDLFFPNRAIKTTAEIKALQAAQTQNESAFKLAFNILKDADIARDKSLIWNGKKLTSEILRGEMNAHLARLGTPRFAGDFYSIAPIVAGGPQSAEPHNRGTGILKANTFILIDSFPMHPNGYWGDCTRTVCKGTPSAWMRDVYAAVLGAQKTALKLIKPEANGKDIHQAVADYLAKAGFKTGLDKNGNPFGFFHGTGHGVGLELHDPGPRTLSTASSILKPGMVTSVEPGLYYPGKGGCRIEDVVVVTKTGHTNLNKLSKTSWVID